MYTPKKIKSLMPKPLQDEFLVHQGFYDYLFDNKEITKEKGKQRFDQIIEDITEILEPGYSIYVTGHRYVTTQFYCLVDSYRRQESHHVFLF